ncbi:germination lipoprotein GerS-related protein [Clostridium akagii]|uniref:germination lipoprotein GerS-related protein n=1 Tax=Clostridium akagii TaxID=91623 RepID=UPI0004788891|nr:germination lipoprotein GerS-related protein [Clostridium akagii]
MKKFFLVLITSVLLVFISGCTYQKETDKDLTPYLKNIKSYSTDMDMTIQNDKQKLNYAGKQFYVQDLGSRLELNKERVFIYTDDKIYVSDLIGGQKYTTVKSSGDVYKISFFNEFIKLLNTNGKTNYEFKEIDGDKYELITTSMAENNRNINRLVLYVNQKEKLPRALVIYDAKGNEKIIIKYKNFKNETIDKNLFNIN